MASYYGYDPVYLAISDKPEAVIGIMDGLYQQQETYSEQLRSRRWLPWVLLLLALPLCALDFLLGFNTCIFALVGGVLTVAALVLMVMMRGGKKVRFPPQFTSARQVIYTLRDDISQKANFLGHLDLTGPRKPEKLRHERPNARGQTVQYYDDEWFKLKLKLFDGNLLRMSATERIKVRKGYFKRSSSGKQKWKQEKVKNEQRIRVRVAVNEAAYTLLPVSTSQVGQRVGNYVVERMGTDGGILEVRATAERPGGGAIGIEANDILSILKYVYNQLQRNAA